MRHIHNHPGVGLDIKEQMAQHGPAEIHNEINAGPAGRGRNNRFTGFITEVSQVERRCQRPLKMRFLSNSVRVVNIIFAVSWRHLAVFHNLHRQNQITRQFIDIPADYPAARKIVPRLPTTLQDSTADCPLRSASSKVRNSNLSISEKPVCGV